MNSISHAQSLDLPSTVGECVEFAVANLSHIDGQILTEHVLSLSRTELVVKAEDHVSAEIATDLINLVEKRKKGEPIAYLVGQQGFWSFLLRVTPDVLIPRPETELLVERALNRVDENSRVLELGTGSGAVAIAIARETGASVVATDACEAALEVCQTNTRNLKAQLTLSKSDWYANVSGKFDVIISNPPYLSETDPHLNCGDLRFEPPMALIAGPNGMESLQKVVHGAPAHLETGGLLAVEHGFNQDNLVRQLFADSGFSEVHTSNDLAGQPRVTSGVYW